MSERYGIPMPESKPASWEAASKAVIEQVDAAKSALESIPARPTILEVAKGLYLTAQALDEIKRIVMK